MTYKHGFREERQWVSTFWKTLLRQYCANTSLHGFRYVVSEETTFIEKIVWFLVCVLCFLIATALMLLVWLRYRRTPTVTTIDTTTHPIFSLDFPAVSICNYNKVYKPHADKFAENMKQKGLNDTEIYNFFTSLPNLIRPYAIHVDNTRALEFLASERISIEDIMFEMMQPCENLLLKCFWEGRAVDCNKIFKPIKSVEGFCCAFNYHVNVTEKSAFGTNILNRKVNLEPPDEQNVEKDLPGVHKVLSVPGAGRDVGLSVVLNLEEDTYLGSIRPSLGASILVHDPFIFPEVELLTSFIQPTQESAVILSASIMVSSPTVRNLNIWQRNCLFADEKKLNTSSVYSYQSCITECRIKHIKRYCNCVPFYYPNKYNERVCNLPDVECLTKYRGSLSNLRTVIDLATGNNTLDSADCECLPTCDDNTYTSNTENAIMDNVSFHSPILDGFDVKNVSLANIYFRGITCLKYRKEAWNSWDNVLASCGGIFGLCMGGSCVSFVEFLYYFVHKIFYGKEIEEKKKNAAAVPPPRLFSIETLPVSARRKFKVVSIDKLEDFTDKTFKPSTNSEINNFINNNYTYFHELQSNGAKIKLEEEFIRNFVKSYE